MCSHQLTKDELIKLVTDIMTVNGTEAEIDAWINIWCANVPHPQAANLIFYPDHLSISDELTPTAIVNIALAYQPIQM
jgi:Colicin immunity protein / pyocin immunity protein